MKIILSSDGGQPVSPPAPERRPSLRILILTSAASLIVAAILPTRLSTVLREFGIYLFRATCRFPVPLLVFLLLAFGIPWGLDHTVLRRLRRIVLFVRKRWVRVICAVSQLHLPCFFRSGPICSCGGQ